MRKGFLIYEEMHKYFTIYEEVVSLDFAIFEKKMLFSFLSV